MAGNLKKNAANNHNPRHLKAYRKSFADFALISPLNFIKKTVNILWRKR